MRHEIASSLNYSNVFHEMAALPAWSPHLPLERTVHCCASDASRFQRIQIITIQETLHTLRTSPSNYFIQTALAHLPPTTCTTISRHHSFVRGVGEVRYRMGPTDWSTWVTNAVSSLFLYVSYERALKRSAFWYISKFARDWYSPARVTVVQSQHGTLNCCQQRTVRSFSAD